MRISGMTTPVEISAKLARAGVSALPVALQFGLQPRMAQRPQRRRWRSDNRFYHTLTNGVFD